jgi:WD40 repeat protein
MNKRPPSFSYLSQTYKAEYSWSLSQAQRPLHPIIAFPRHTSQTSFIISKNAGLMVCEDFKTSGTLSEISTEKLQVSSIDYCPDASPLAVLSFNLGHILLINPVLRRRGKVVWLNTRRNQYSSRAPTVVRWLSSQHFLVLFGDSSLFCFDRSLEGEDEKFIQAAQTNTLNSTRPVVHIALPYPEANPVSFWRLKLGKVRDLSVGKTNLLAINAENSIKIMDVTENQVKVTLQPHFAGFQTVSWSQDGRILAAGGEDDCVHVWRTDNWQLMFRGVGHCSWVSSVAFWRADEGLRLCSVGQDGLLCIWDLEDPAPEPVSFPLSPVPYPRKSLQRVHSPSLQTRVSDEPLLCVEVQGGSFFVCDGLGTIHQWLPSPDAGL